MGNRRTLSLSSVLKHEGHERRRKSRKPFALFVPFRAFRGSRHLVGHCNPWVSCGILYKTT